MGGKKGRRTQDVRRGKGTCGYVYDSGLLITTIDSEAKRKGGKRRPGREPCERKRETRS